jgi:mannose-6-phosphate isomerase-like protein (cupin superfamily)
LNICHESKSIEENVVKKVNLNEQFAGIKEYWQPLVVGELNGQEVKLTKLKGEFVMHHHEDEDEMFLVVSGTLEIVFEDRTEVLEKGEFLVIPRGIPHMPVAKEEVEIILFEPASTRNTGNVVNERTVENPRSIF